MTKTFQEICTFEVLYQAYLDARKGKRGKASAAQYEANALMLTERLENILNTKRYIPSKFETFYVYEPKKRMALRSTSRLPPAAAPLGLAVSSSLFREVFSNGYQMETG